MYNFPARQTLGLEFLEKLLFLIEHNLSTAAVTIEQAGKKFDKTVVSGPRKVQWQFFEFWVNSALIFGKMLGFTTSRDGLLQIEEDVLFSVVQRESILGFYNVDKTPLGR